MPASGSDRPDLPPFAGRDANPMAQILDALPHGIFWKGLDGAYLGCNRVFAQAAGLDDPDQVVGLTDFDLPWPTAESEAYRADDLEVISQAQAKTHIVEPLLRADGTRLWIDTTKVPLLDAHGKPCGVLGHFEDVTDHLRVVQALRESENRLRYAFEGANDGLWDVTMATGEVYLSPRGCEILGYRPEELAEINRVWYELVHAEDLPLTHERLEAHLAGRTPMFEVEQRLRTKDGEWKWVLARGKVVERNPDGSARRMTGTHTDLTERKAAEAERRALTAQLHQSQKLESLGSLAGGVAHDINNVLAAILGLASTQRDGLEASQPLARALDTITSACLRGRDVVKSLLYFARKDLESFGPVDLNAIVFEMTQLLQSTTLKRVAIATDLQENLGLIEGDAGALSHSLMNLCLNALDAMPEGGTITIRSRRLAEGGIELSVRDTGAGMTEEVRKQAVEPFFTTKPAGKGTGLGLAMVYGTVKAHGGTFRIRSTPGRGTEVILGFQAFQPDAPAEFQAAAPGAGAAIRPLRILLVDDDELVRAAFAPMLVQCGHQVQTAEGGQEALDRMQEGLDPDLVILDMNMPGLNGAQTLTRLLALNPSQAVLMATGYSDQDLNRLLEDHRQVACIRKPFTLQEIQEKIAGLAVPAPGPGERPAWRS